MQSKKCSPITQSSQVFVSMSANLPPIVGLALGMGSKAAWSDTRSPTPSGHRKKPWLVRKFISEGGSQLECITSPATPTDHPKKARKLGTAFKVKSLDCSVLMQHAARKLSHAEPNPTVTALAARRRRFCLMPTRSPSELGFTFFTISGTLDELFPALASNYRTQTIPTIQSS